MQNKVKIGTVLYRFNIPDSEVLERQVTAIKEKINSKGEVEYQHFFLAGGGQEWEIRFFEQYRETIEEALIKALSDSASAYAEQQKVAIELYNKLLSKQTLSQESQSRSAV